MKIKTDNCLKLEFENGVKITIKENSNRVANNVTIEFFGFPRILNLRRTKHFKFLLYKDKKEYRKSLKAWKRLYKNDQLMLDANKRSKKAWRELK